MDECLDDSNPTSVAHSTIDDGAVRCAIVDIACRRFRISILLANNVVERRRATDAWTAPPGWQGYQVCGSVWGQTQHFIYDHRDRLTRAWTSGSAGYPGMAYDISTTYDTLGNLLSKSGVGSYSYGANGPFQPKVDYATSVNPVSIATGDFNGDGAPDLSIANNGSANIAILLN